MKLNSAQVEQTLNQLDAQAIPEDHPMVPKLNELFGDHTFFLNNDGLNVVEPSVSAGAGGQAESRSHYDSDPLKRPRASMRNTCGRQAACAY